jgi:hypothetical protein
MSNNPTSAKAWASERNHRGFAEVYSMLEHEQLF